MASVAMMLGGAVVNALAFSGSNYFFSKLGDKDDHEKEMKRHNEAVENLAKASDMWHEKREQRLDFINERLRKQSHSIKTFQNIDDAMHEYAVRFGKGLTPLEPEPVLDDFYVKSESQHQHEVIFVAIGMVMLVGGAIWWRRNEKK